MKGFKGGDILDEKKKIELNDKKISHKIKASQKVVSDVELERQERKEEMKRIKRERKI
jgi:hypothetical protein